MIPYPKGIKHRTGILTGDRNFYWEKGSVQTLLWAPYTEPAKIAFLMEGETDTMRVWQEVGSSTHVFGLPGVESWKPEWANQFDAYDRVYVFLDNDQPETSMETHIVQSRVERVWGDIRRSLGPKAKLIKWPGGVKDACDFFSIYDKDDFRTLLKTAPASVYKAMDFTAMDKPVEIDWLVEGLIAKGDISIWFGPPYVGKSVLSMSLAAAIVKGEPTWLGLPLLGKGRVLYVDEENPEGVILSRLHRLGVRPEHQKDLRYLHEQAVRLDREPDKLLQEALNFEPNIIFIDSLTRVHTQDEINAGAMATVFNDGVKPLARQTGAAVVILHHATKSDEGSSYQRMRGTGDLSGVIDNGLDVKMMNLPGWVELTQFKTRNGLPHAPITARFEDYENGLRVVTNVEAPPPF